VLIKDFKVPSLNITFLTDSVIKQVAAMNWYCVDSIYEPNMKKKMSLIKKKFDVVVGNPPYQSASGNKGKGNILWDKFLMLANETVHENGYVSLIHPSLWRKPGHKLQKQILTNDLQYLEIHDEKDGMKTFGAETRYDWYIMRKSTYSGRTVVKDQQGQVHVLNIEEWAFIPNYAFDLLSKLLAKAGEEKVEILNSRSAYEPRKIWMSPTQDVKHKYPCVYMVRKDDTPDLKWSSRNDKGHFGIPKVIYAGGRPISAGFLVDTSGKYGMTQWASGIVDAPENLEKIAIALCSGRFRQFCAAIAVSKLEINTSVLRLFRKDFWKEFSP